jgi:hypothetical protein
MKDPLRTHQQQQEYRRKPCLGEESMTQVPHLLSAGSGVQAVDDLVDSLVDSWHRSD